MHYDYCTRIVLERKSFTQAEYYYVLTYQKIICMTKYKYYGL